MIDALRPRARERLDQAMTIWLTTVTPSGQPQTMPVWFLFDGDDFSAKYRPVLDGYQWTGEKFRTDYPDVLRIRPTKVRAGHG